MSTTTSSDGTTIAYEKSGTAVNTVCIYDRRGRGESGDTAPYSIEREVDDLAAGKRSKAVKLFMRLVEVPAPVVTLMPLMPVWSKLKGIAHTLPYDHALVGDSPAGHESPLPHWANSAVQAVAAAIPGAEHRTIAGQTHLLKPDAIAPVLREYFR